MDVDVVRDQSCHGRRSKSTICHESRPNAHHSGFSTSKINHPSTSRITLEWEFNRPSISTAPRRSTILTSVMPWRSLAVPPNQRIVDGRRPVLSLPSTPRRTISGSCVISTVCAVFFLGLIPAVELLTRAISTMVCMVHFTLIQKNLRPGCPIHDGSIVMGGVMRPVQPLDHPYPPTQHHPAKPLACAKPCQAHSAPKPHIPNQIDLA